MDQPGERSDISSFIGFCATLGFAAENHYRARPEILHFVDAKLANLGTIESRRNKRANVTRIYANLRLWLCSSVADRTRAKANQRQKGAAKHNEESN